MKYCPNCQTRYTDNTLRFCLQDGAPLAESVDENFAPTVSYGENVQLNETETIISSRGETPAVQPRAVEPIRIDLPAASEQSPQQHPLPPAVDWQTAAAPRRSKTLPLVLLTALATLVLAGAGAWLYLRNNRAETARNGAANVGAQSAAQNANSKPNVSNTPVPTATTPRNEANANVANVAAVNNSTPAPNVDRKQIEEEVADRVDSWASLTESRDINGYMNYYADTVDYYNRRGVSTSFIRGDKQRAFNDFDSIEMNVSDLSVTPDASGDGATAVFDKEWVFDGAEKSSSGKVRTELKMKKIKGKWLITSERDLKVYYIK
jgi:ketosteroid isomerase-like protein